MRYRTFRAKLVTTTALHIGTGRWNEVTDALVRRDLGGRILIPGTAIAGSLRALATRLAPRLNIGADAEKRICLALKPREEIKEAEKNKRPCGCSVCHLFGDILPGVGDREDFRNLRTPWMYDDENTTRASRVFIEDALAENDRIETLVRDSVGIDRASGAAARAGAVKFDAEVIPSGTSFKLQFELEDSATINDINLLITALAEWEAGRGALGGRTMRGLGQFKLEKYDLANDASAVQFAERDLHSANGLLSFLKAMHPSDGIGDNGAYFSERVNAVRQLLVATPEPNITEIASNWVEVEMTLLGKGPVLTHDVTIAALTGFDHAPLLAKLPHRHQSDESWVIQPVLSGASLRGVIRSHAEKIARTLWSDVVNGKSENEKLARCPACNPTESRKIKQKKPGIGEKEKIRFIPLKNCDSLLRESKLNHLPDDEEVKNDHLCLACRLFGSTRRGSRLRVDDAPLLEPLPTKWWKAQDFLAIDRFLGGSLENAKFDALPLMNPKFRFCLRLENPCDWEIGWLALVMRDLYKGMLRVGFGAAKGYGEVYGQNLRVSVGYLTTEDFPLSSAFLPEEEIFDGIYRIAEFNEGNWLERKDLQDHVKQQIDGFVNTVEKFDRREMKLDAIPADTYFGVVDQWFGGQS